jgi:hypothetical protein
MEPIAKRSIMNDLGQITCRIATRPAPGGKVSTGTGFFFGYPADEGDVVMLITNRHVVENMNVAELVLSPANKDGQRVAGELERLSIGNLQSIVIYHPDPDVDLAAIGIGGVLAGMRAVGKHTSFVAISVDTIPPAEEIFSDIEEVLMIGYPVGVYDSVNNRPVVRRGITATSLGFDYDGKGQFLLDAPSHHGSSGSPVVIANEGSWNTISGLMMGTRFRLVGVLFAQMQYGATGEIVTQPVPTTAGQFSVTQIPMNLGVCIKAHRIHELVAAVKRAATDNADVRPTLLASPGSSPLSAPPGKGAIFT